MRITKLVTFFLLLSIVGCSSFGFINRRIDLANEGDVEAQHDLCFAYIYGNFEVLKNYDKARYWCELAAKQDNYHSMTLYGEIFFNGYGVARDYQIAYEWFTKAALLGHPHAQYVVALMYSKGLYVPVDREKAVYWADLSSKQDYKYGQELLIKLSNEPE